MPPSSDDLKTRHVLHLLPSSPAAALLRHEVPRLPGRHDIVALPDVYGLGPLTDGPGRARFLAQWFTHTGSAWYAGDDVSAPLAGWARLHERLAAITPDAVAVWSTASGADLTFLSMACHHLARVATPLLQVRASAADGRAEMACNLPAALAAHYAEATLLENEQRDHLAAQFGLLAEWEGLRETDADGIVQLRDSSHHDALVEACVPVEWRPALWLAAEVSARDDGRNPLTPAFLMGRIAHLARSGAMEADPMTGDPARMRVRRRATRA